MCSLCGILGGRGHWTESASSPEVFAGRAEAHTPGRERQHRIRILNVVLRHYGLSLSDWTAGKSVLRSTTGRNLLVENVGELWPAAERLAGRPLDPLDPALLAALAPSGFQWMNDGVAPSHPACARAPGGSGGGDAPMPR